MRTKLMRYFPILLLLFLIFGMLPLPMASASSSGSVIFEAATVEAEPGASDVRIPIRLKNNPGIAGIKLKVAYDTSRLALDDVQFNTAWSGDFMPPQTKNSPVSLTWFNGTANETAPDSVFVTLIFHVLPDARPGSAPLTISYDPNNIYNITNQNLNVDTINGAITVKPRSVPAEQAVFEVGSQKAAPGDSDIRIPVRLKNNPGVTSIKLKLAYDTSRLILEDIQFNSAWSGQFMPPQTKDSPVSLTWFNGIANETATDSVFVTLVFRALENAPSGDAPLTVSYDPNNIHNIDGNNLNVAIVNGKINIRSKPVPPASPTLRLNDIGHSSVTVAIDQDFLGQLDNQFTGSCIVALYDTNGKMVACTAKEVTKASHTITLSYDLHGVDAATGTVFLTNTNHTALCDCIDFTVPPTNNQ